MKMQYVLQVLRNAALMLAGPNMYLKCTVGEVGCQNNEGRWNSIARNIGRRSNLSMSMKSVDSECSEWVEFF